MVETINLVLRIQKNSLKSVTVEFWEFLEVFFIFYPLLNPYILGINQDSSEQKTVISVDKDDGF